MSHPIEKIEAVVELAHAELLQARRYDRACILASRIFVTLARQQGLLCKPVPCNVLAANSEAVTLIRSGVPTHQWPSTAWTVGVHGDTPRSALTSESGGYSWHLTVEVHLLLSDKRQKFPVDVNSDQFDRPFEAQTAVLWYYVIVGKRRERERNMQLVVKIETDNDAFQPSISYELSRILKGLAEKIEDGMTPEYLMDANGNTVGTISWEVGE